MWSGSQIALRMPTGATDRGGVNYVDIGGQIPPEIASFMTVAAVFYATGVKPPLPSLAKYYALGITQANNVEFVAAYDKIIGGVQSTYLVTLFTFYLDGTTPTSDPLFILGKYLGSFASGNVGISLPGGIQYQDDSLWTAFTPNSPTVAGGTGCSYRVRNGRCDVAWDVSYSGGGFAKNFLINTLPVGARPGRAMFIAGWSYTGVPFGVFVHTDGTCTADIASASSIGGFVASGSFPVS